MSQNVFSITDNSIPIEENDFILLDTNVVIDITGYRNSTLTRAKEAKSFISRMSHTNNIFVIPTKVWEEINIIVESDIIQNKHKDKNADIKDLTKSVNTTVSQLKSALDTFPNIYPEPIGSIDSRVLNKASENRVNYGLKWGDASIVAIAQEEEIKNIFTFDMDYANVSDPNINILLNSKLYEKYKNQTNSIVIPSNSTTDLK